MRLAAAAAKVDGSVLTPLIRMMNDGVGPPLRNRHLKGVDDEACAEMRRHRPPHDPATPHVEHDREIQRLAPRGNVRDVSHPELIGVGRCEAALHQTRRRTARSARTVVTGHLRRHQWNIRAQPSRAALPRRSNGEASRLSLGGAVGDRRKVYLGLEPEFGFVAF